MSRNEARILAAERRVENLDGLLRRLREELVAIQQGIPTLDPDEGCPTYYAFTVTDAATSLTLAGATVDVLDQDGLIAATGTTDGSGLVTLVVGELESYTYLVTDSGYTSASGALGTAGCNTVVPQAVALTSSCSNTFSGTLSGTFNTITTSSSALPVFGAGTVPISGATVTLTNTGTGAVLGTATTNGSGAYSVTFGAVSGTAVGVTAVTAASEHVVGGATANCTSKTVNLLIGPICGSGAGQVNIPTSFTVTDTASPGHPTTSFTLNNNRTLASGADLMVVFQYGNGLVGVQARAFGPTIVNSSPTTAAMVCSPFSATFAITTSGFSNTLTIA